MQKNVKLERVQQKQKKNITCSLQKPRAQLFKTNDVVSLCIVKTLIIKYGIYANIFAEKM